MEKQIKIDTDKCILCGHCSMSYPLSYDMDFDKVKVLNNKGKEAIKECPVGAISEE